MFAVLLLRLPVARILDGRHAFQTPSLFLAVKFLLSQIFQRTILFCLFKSALLLKSECKVMAFFNTDQIFQQKKIELFFRIFATLYFTRHQVLKKTGKISCTMVS